MHEHFLSSAGADLFRPFTGKHRAIFFEVVTEIYERTIGVNADMEIVLDRHALNDIIVGALEKNRGLIFANDLRVTPNSTQSTAIGIMPTRCGGG